MILILIKINFKNISLIKINFVDFLSSQNKNKH